MTRLFLKIPTAIRSIIMLALAFGSFLLMREKENLTLDEKALEEYIQSILSPEEDSTEQSFFEDENDIFKYAGSGDGEVGRAYLMNETAVRNFVKDLNKK